MNVKLILPALAEAKGPYWRSIKYSLFPPLGLASLAAHLGPDDQVSLVDEHVEPVLTDDRPDVVGIETYITSARRAYQLADHYRARGSWVCLGGLHPTSLPQEAAAHADTVFVGPGEDTWPAFLADYRAGRPGKLYRSTTRDLTAQPPPRRDLIKSELYLVPNSLVVTRGCPHRCEFCYKESFFAGGKSFYTRRVDQALAEIASLPGRHLFFLDDHLFGDAGFCSALFDGMRGMGRLWQAAGTVSSVLRGELIAKAAACGLRSLFVGFETLSSAALAGMGKHHNFVDDYGQAIRRLHELGVMINASFVFGADQDDEWVFQHTVEWAIAQGIETATFHILTPYPGTVLHQRLAAEGRILHRNWDWYDTRHAVFQPAGMTPQRLEEGYWQAYEDFYRWGSIFRSAAAKPTLREMLRHVAYTGAWKKLEPFWNLLIRCRRVWRMRPAMERVLAGRTSAARRQIGGLIKPKDVV
jgi:radical SAM superfamily enzyme YgiQ (UPF0313 family)